MRIPLQKLMEFVRSGVELPPLREMLNYLHRQEATSDDWFEFAPTLAAAYKLDVEEIEDAAGLRPKVDDFLKLMDKLEIGGWLREVTLLCDGMESPAAFNFASALAIEAALLRRRVWIDQGFFKIWPATQVMLAAPTASSKTSGADFIKDYIAAPTKAFNLLPDEGSGEGLKKRLAKLTATQGEATGLLMVGELSTFLGKQEFNASLTQQLADLFDSRNIKIRETISRGEEVMQNIAISAILCSNEELLADAVPPQALGAGLFSRIVIFHHPAGYKFVSRPIHPPKDIIDSLIATATRIALLQGETTWGLGAGELYDKLYMQYMRRALEGDWRMAGWFRRLAKQHMPRMAMLLAISEEPQPGTPLVMEERHIQQARGVLDWVTNRLPDLYAYLGNSPYGAKRQEVVKAIEHAGGKISDKQLGLDLGRVLSRKELDEHLRDMVRSGTLEPLSGPQWNADERGGWKMVRKVKR